MTRRSTQTSQNTQNTQISASASSAAVSVVVPGDLETRTGGYGYDRRIIDGLRDLGWTVHLVGLDEGFPMPAPAARARAVESFAGIPDGSIVLVDGLALGALPDEVQREAERLTIVALVHHPLAAETGLDPARAAALKVSERRACRVIPIARATQRYQSQAKDQSALKIRLPGAPWAMAQSRVRYGYRRLHVLLAREGWQVNHKRVYRLYRLEGLSLRLKTR